ncbi:tyrosine-type recombinase/integrase [Actinosynnema sp. NPDC059797]
MASIDPPKANGRTKVRWWANGRQKSKTLPDMESAKRFKAALEGDMVNATWIDPRASTVSVREYGERWFNSLTLKESTLESKEGILRNHIYPVFGDLPLSAVNTYMINTWITTSLETKARGSVTLHCNVLSGIFAAAVTEGVIKTNPTVGMRRPGFEYKEQQFLTLEESWRLIDNAPPAIRAMVALAIFGGLRFGELSALRRRDVSVESSQVRVQRTAIYARRRWHFTPPKTKYSRRTVTVPRSVAALIGEHMSAFTPDNPDALVFGHPTGMPYQRGAFRLMFWLPLIERAGLPGLRFHDLRHTFVSLWVALGRNPKEVSRAAGHSSVSFTLDRYGHLYDEGQDGLADALDALVTPGHLGTRNGAVRPSEGAGSLVAGGFGAALVVEEPHRTTLGAGQLAFASGRRSGRSGAFPSPWTSLALAA